MHQGEYKARPNKKGKASRSFGGNNWYGGYSDHLPVFLKMGFL